MSVFDILENPPLLHAIIVHFPVALGIIGVPLVFMVALLDTERNVLRWFAVMTYALMAACAVAALESGERARDRVPNTLPPEVYQLLDQHQEMGEKVWIPAAATAVLLLLSVVNMRWFRNATISLAMLASLACAGLVILTGHYGGTLVHKYGVSGAIMLRANGTAPPALLPATPPQGEVTEQKPQQLAPPVEKPVETAPAPVVPGTQLAPAPAAPAPAAPAAPSFPPPAESVTPPLPPAQEPVSYIKNVQPIIQANCVECHGDSETKGDLSLTSVAGMLKAGEHNGAGLVAGQPENSSIIKHLRGELLPQMPFGKLPLSAADIETLTRWIAEGAKDDTPPAAPAQ